MKAASRRALLGVLTIAAVLLPAAGIAYLGAVSYDEDRGIVAARLDEQFRSAQVLAGHVEAEMREALDAVAAAFSDPAPDDGYGVAVEALAERHPLAARPFVVGRGGRLRYPAPDPLQGDGEGSDEPDYLSRTPRACPERGFDRCIRDLRAAQRRARQLEDARRREVGPCAVAETTCTADPRALADARRSYTALARFDDTGPEALAGLARIERAVGQGPQAVAHYRELARRFGGRVDADGVSYRFIADLGAAGIAAEPRERLLVYRQLIDRSYLAPSASLAVAAERLREQLAGDALAPEERAELRALDAALARARHEAALAASLAGEVDDVVRTAGAQPRGRPALDGSGRTLVYRRDGAQVVGVVVDEALLEQVAAGAGIDLSTVAPGAHAEIDRLGMAPRTHLRVLASAGFGTLLPHLGLTIVHDRSHPDPLDSIVRARGRRHLALTGVLVAVLLVGLTATIRGAARQRELARLKSDFVSTVSHELKTPLTSIRMFAEMLQQGVAGSDRTRESRYHEIIVKESQRLGLLIANLLDYAQIERGTRRYQQHPEAVVEIVRDAVETFQRFREGERQEVRVATDPDAADALVLVDHEVIVQSVLNLLANAAKYGGADKPIDVYVRAAADRVWLTVTDYGPGIPPAEQQRIFREFYRAPEAYKSGVEGTGLGLALVKRHVEAQGGAVELQSALGRGSAFSLVFPRLREGADAGHALDEVARG